MIDKFTLLALTAAALLLAGCRKADLRTAPEEGATYARIAAGTVAAGGTRAYEGYQDRVVEPLEYEKRITSAMLLSGSLTPAYLPFPTVSSGDKYDYTITDPAVDVFVSDPFATTPRTDRLALVLNPNGLVLHAADFSPDKLVTMEQIGDLLGGKITTTTSAQVTTHTFQVGRGLTMTGKTESTEVEILPGISLDNVGMNFDADNNFNDPETNAFNLGSVERVLAKAQVHFPGDAGTEAQEYQVPLLRFAALGSGGPDLDPIDELYGIDYILYAYWSVGSSGKESYLFADRAGSFRYQTDPASPASGKYIYAGFTSAIDDKGTESVQKMSEVISRYGSLPHFTNTYTLPTPGS